MAELRDAGRWPARPRRSRRRWTIACGVAACWVVLLGVTGSAVGATVVLALLGVLGVVGVAGLRALGVTRDHPWVRQLASRPWRDGQDVLQLALRHLPEVFVVTPSGSRLAPNVIELQLNPDDLRSLVERIDIDLVAESVAEVYAEQVAAHEARFAGAGPVQVSVVAEPSLPPGRYRLRQGQPVAYQGQSAAYLGQPAYQGQPAPYRERPAAYPEPEEPLYPDFEIHDGRTRAASAPAELAQAEPARAEPARALAAGGPTVLERRAAIPTLRLVSGDSTAETATSGARAGRGAVELRLPQVPTVSREHARFTFSGGQWWIANLGMNGLAVNGVSVAGECPLSSGDLIRWGTRPDALRSLVEIVRPDA
jgi:FHA domain/Protein of unknown function (DUF3662)